MIDVKLINGIALAFEGDAIYSTYVRRHLIFQGKTKPSRLHHEATKYVSAKAQAYLVEQWLAQGILNEEEEQSVPYTLGEFMSFLKTYWKNLVTISLALILVLLNLLEYKGLIALLWLIFAGVNLFFALMKNPKSRKDDNDNKNL